MLKADPANTSAPLPSDTSSLLDLLERETEPSIELADLADEAKRNALAYRLGQRDLVRILKHRWARRQKGT